MNVLRNELKISRPSVIPARSTLKAKARRPDDRSALRDGTGTLPLFGSLGSRLLGCRLRRLVGLGLGRRLRSHFTGRRLLCRLGNLFVGLLGLRFWGLVLHRVPRRPP